MLKTKLLFVIFVLSCFLMGQAVFAQGDGTGGGQGEGLTLVSSSISDGATGVSLKPQMKLTFSKNIVNMSVKDNNLKCFSLQMASGTVVPIDITLADDQIDFDARNDAIITPKSNLDQGTSYSLIVSSSLRSKSGVTTGKEIRISFTTEGTKPAAATNAAPVTASQIVPSTPKAGTTTSAATNKTVAPQAAAQNAGDSQVKTTGGQTANEQPPAANNENKITAENAKAEKPKPSKDAKTESIKTLPHRSFSLYLIPVSMIIAAIAIYYYLRKKKENMVS